MKPKTKEQERILEMTQLLPAISEKDMEYGKRHCFDQYAIASRNRYVCTDCGHTWLSKESAGKDKVVCPHCHKELSVRNHKARLIEKSYLCVSSSHQGYQIIRWFMVMRETTKKGFHYRFDEVGVEWISQRGTLFSVEKRRWTMSYYVDAWIYDSDMELRRRSTFANWLCPSAILTKSVMPILSRNGFNKENCFTNFQSMFMQALLKDAQFESAYKCGHLGACLQYMKQYSYYKTNTVDCYKFSKEQLLLIKLANRKGFKFSTKGMWIDRNDYMNDLITCGKDIHNTNLMFPDNFQEAHVYWSMRANNIRQRQARERKQQMEIRRALDEAKKSTWTDEYTLRFSDMLIQSGGYTIRPLITMDDFRDMANKMNNCVVTYFGKVNTLLLSIERNGKKIECAEIYLPNKDIVQCRGVNNMASDLHDEIVELLKSQMKVFYARYTREFVKKSDVAEQPEQQAMMMAVQSE